MLIFLLYLYLYLWTAELIAIIDYGMGNLRSVQKGFENVGYTAVITSDADVVSTADGVVLPGVGAFGDAMAHLRSSGLDEAVKTAILAGRPFLGICLGLQLLFAAGYEDGEHAGLGIFDGTVEKLPAGVKIPHMGWNQITKVKDAQILRDIPDDANFYFVHSYAVKPGDNSLTATLTDYAGGFVSGIVRDNVSAFQFHPEKSSAAGLQILRNFGGMCK